MAKPYPCLWFDGNAEEAAGFYVTLLPDSHVDKVWRSPAETPSGPAGTVLTVDFTFADGQTVTLAVKETGDVFEVKINGKVQPLRNQDDHAATRERGKREWYEHFEVRVAKVERAYNGPLK